MIYELKHFDTPLLRFSAEEGADPNVKVLWVNRDCSGLLPLDLDRPDPEGIVSWVKHRSIPKNRAYVNVLLGAMGLSINRPFDILRISKGLSLNDSYWVTEEGFKGSFASCNLYDNRFNRVLGEIAFTGYGSSGNRISSSPEFTTNGILPKCWRRENRTIKLYKGGTTGASNTGFEPYSEYYAYQIAEVMGIKAIPYRLSLWKGTLCSVCDLFTDINHSFVPVGRIVKSGGMKAVRAYYESLGEPFTDALNDMLVLDALILNTDRHFGNFGFMVDSRSNQIIVPAPLFDHGNSLLNQAGIDIWETKEGVFRYADSLLPRVYDDFLNEARPVLTHRHKEGLRRLISYRFRKNPRYNLSEKRLNRLEEVVHRQAQRLLEND